MPFPLTLPSSAPPRAPPQPWGGVPSGAHFRYYSPQHSLVKFLRCPVRMLRERIPEVRTRRAAKAHQPLGIMLNE